MLDLRQLELGFSGLVLIVSYVHDSRHQDQRFMRPKLVVTTLQSRLVECRGTRC